MTCSTVVSLLAATLAFLPGVQAGRPTAQESIPARTVNLMIAPAPLDATKAPSLLPTPDELTDDDGAQFYAQAVQALPEGVINGRLVDWLGMPLGDLPRTQVQAALQPAKASLDLVTQGARCKQCGWPSLQPGVMPVHLAKYRDLARLLCLQARLQIAQRRCDLAIRTMQTGLAMARQISDGPTVVQGTTGVAIAATMLRCAEDLAQAPDSPNLYVALQALPHPLIDLTQPISEEMKSLDANAQYSELTRAVVRRQMESSFNRVRQLMDRLDGTVAALQCIETIRHYAATHEGSLPVELADITDLKIPADPATGEPFTYRLDGTKAILDVTPPKGGKSRDAVHYVIAVAR